MPPVCTLRHNAHYPLEGLLGILRGSICSLTSAYICAHFNPMPGWSPLPSVTGGTMVTAGLCPAFTLPVALSDVRARAKSQGTDVPKLVARKRPEFWLELGRLTFWMILQSHPVFLGFSFFFWWVGMEILNERL